MAASVDAASSQYEPLLKRAKESFDSIAERQTALSTGTEEAATRIVEAMGQAAESTRTASTEAVQAMAETGRTVQNEVQAKQERVTASMDCAVRPDCPVSPVGLFRPLTLRPSV